MPEPFAAPEAPRPDTVVSTLEKGSRARQILQLGVGEDLARRREAIWRVAEEDLRAGRLTPDLAMLHVACSNALRRYPEELAEDITRAQRAAERLHAEPDEPETPAD